MRRPESGWIAVGCAVLVIFGGCGERSFEAEEFVDEANANGAELSLGEPLISTEEGIDVYALTLAESAEPGHSEDPGHASEEHVHGGGSLTVTDGSDLAAEEYESCEGAATLICYRAANVVLAFEELPPDERATMNAAIRAMASE